MFAVIEPGGNKVTYVPGVFRQRKVPKVEKTSLVKSVSKEGEGFQDKGSRTLNSIQVQKYEESQGEQQLRLSALQAKDIMSSPVFTLPPTASLTEAWGAVQSHRFRHIPILGKSQFVEGILSDRDLARGTVDSALAGVKGAVYLEQISIQPFVSFPVLVSGLDSGIWSIAKVLLEERIGAMPVVSSKGDLAGIITRTDILRALVAHPNFERWV